MPSRVKAKRPTPWIGAPASGTARRPPPTPPPRRSFSSDPLGTFLPRKYRHRPPRAPASQEDSMFRGSEFRPDIKAQKAIEGDVKTSRRPCCVRAVRDEAQYKVQRPICASPQPFTSCLHFLSCCNMMELFDATGAEGSDRAANAEVEQCAWSPFLSFCSAQSHYPTP